MMGCFLAPTALLTMHFRNSQKSKRRMIRIGTKTKIVALCRAHVYSKSGVILPSTELPDYLFADTIDPSE